MPCSPVVLKRVKWLLCTIFKVCRRLNPILIAYLLSQALRRGSWERKRGRTQLNFSYWVNQRCTETMFLVWVDTPSECIYFDLYWFSWDDWLISCVCISTCSFVGGRVCTCRAQPNKRKQTKFHFIQGSLTGYNEQFIRLFKNKLFNCYIHHLTKWLAKSKKKRHGTQICFR